MTKTSDLKSDYEGSSYCGKDDDTHLDHIPHDRDLLHHIESIDKIIEIVLNLHLHSCLVT